MPTLEYNEQVKSKEDQSPSEREPDDPERKTLDESIRRFVRIGDDDSHRDE